MTVGEKIKYYRKQAGLTQSQLATATNIHLVSIKKYETNKMQPQLPQIEKITAALSIGTNALLDITNFTLSCETVADFMGILIMLCNSHIISIHGVRENDGFLKPETVEISLNNSSFLASLFKLRVSGKEITSLNQISIQIPNSFVMQDLIKWEKLNYLYNRALEEIGDNPDDAAKAAIEVIASTKETIELELQRSMVLLDTNDGIKVKINP